MDEQVQPRLLAVSLVRQARDAWVELGYKFQSSDADWNDPFPAVSMRTERDDFWMTALTGVVNRTKGEGLAAISVTSPCFSPSSASTADSAALHHTPADKRAADLALEHSSRIYDALHVRHAPEQKGEGLSHHQDLDGDFVQHTWSTQPLTEQESLQALERVQSFFERGGWEVHLHPTGADGNVIVARHNQDGSIAHITTSAAGAVHVAVATPAVRVESTSI